jgi:UDP-N-acetylmuramate: L-alanyl-gamma-D-glutamyl-meso-diaminopimelate ligase
MHLHIIGICGTFMGGLAQLARAKGMKVTGCDANVYPPMSTQLQAAGIDLIEGFSADQLALKPDVWVVGNVASRGMPLIEALLNNGDRLVSGPQWLAENILGQHPVAAISGTHGKTTTSSILAWILEDAGMAPSFLIGGVPENFGVSARLTTAGSPFVIEADEYDTAFFDKRSKFLHYRAKVAVFNNLEFDHADIFTDLAAIETQFHHWVRTLPSNGRLVVNAQEPALSRVMDRGAWTPVDYFHAVHGWAIGEISGSRSASNFENGSESTALSLANSAAPADQRSDQLTDQFQVLLQGSPVGVVQSPLTGDHNRSNVLAAIAAAVALGVPAKKACQAVSRFQGVKRRMQVRGTVNGVVVLDDFAHHPTAIATTIEGLQAQMQRQAISGRILAVIEPRSNTMKLGVVAAKLAPSLQQADQVFAFAGGIQWDLASALSALGDRAHTFTDLDHMVRTIAASARPNDHVLVMSNGGFGGIHEKLISTLANQSLENQSLAKSAHAGQQGA